VACAGRSTSVARQAAYGQRPLQFEANQGQAADPVDFLARGPGYALFLTPGEAVLSLRSGSAPGTAPPDKKAEFGHQPDSVLGANADVLRMQLMGGAARAPVGEAELPGTVNYLLGGDPTRWRTGVPTYGRVRYAAVYPGIDLAYYAQGANLEYDFVLAPGAAPEQIMLRYAGAESLELDPTGDLLLHLHGSTVRQERPLVYQEREGRRELVDGGYALVNPAAHDCDERGDFCSGAQLPNEQNDEPRVAFWLGDYDPDRPLVIDPTLVYSTYLGGSGDESGRGIAVDGQGQTYITGETTSTDFPQATTTQKGNSDAYVTKLNAAGTPLYTTYVGGGGSDRGNAIAVDRACTTSCTAFVTGLTFSSDFPQVNPLPTANNAGILQWGYEAFVTRLSATGDMLLYSTYLGGTGANLWEPGHCAGSICNLDWLWAGTLGDEGTGIAVDGQGQAYVTGHTYSSDFPLANPLPTGDSLHGDGDAFVVKLNAAGNALLYSTYLGGGGLRDGTDIYLTVGIREDDGGAAIAVDGQGQAYVTGFAGSSSYPLVNPLPPPGNTLQGGSDAFVAKLSGAGNTLLYSTYLGGSAADSGYGIAVDGQGQAYVTGQTSSADFPMANNTLHGQTNAFVTRLSATGNSLLYSMYLGGSSNDTGAAIAVDGQENAYVTGHATSVDFPLVDPLQANTMLQGSMDAFETRLKPDGAVASTTYLGGSGADEGNAIAVDSSGTVYVTGDTGSLNFPTLNASQPALGGSSDAFVAQLSPAISTPAPSVSPTLSATPTPSPSLTPSPTTTPSPSPSPTASPTATSTSSATATPTAPPTTTATATPTLTNTPTPSASVMLVQTNILDSTGTAATVQYSSGVSAGDLLIAAVRLGKRTASAAITDNNGNTWTRIDQRADTGGGSGEDFELWYAENALTSPNARPTLNVRSSASASIRAVIAEYHGLVTSGSLDQHATAIGTGASPLVVSGTTSQPTELIVGYGEVENATSFTPRSGFSNDRVVPSGSGAKLALEHMVSSSIGAQTATYSVTAQNWGMGIATFRVAPLGAQSFGSPSSAPIPETVVVSM
jgi:hypothetical protein